MPTPTQVVGYISLLLFLGEILIDIKCPPNITRNFSLCFTYCYSLAFFSLDEKTGIKLKKIKIIGLGVRLSLPFLWIGYFKLSPL